MHVTTEPWCIVIPFVAGWAKDVLVFRFTRTMLSWSACCWSAIWLSVGSPRHASACQVEASWCWILNLIDQLSAWTLLKVSLLELALFLLSLLMFTRFWWSGMEGLCTARCRISPAVNDAGLVVVSATVTIGIGKVISFARCVVLELKHTWLAIFFVCFSSLLRLGINILYTQELWSPQFPC